MQGASPVFSCAVGGSMLYCHHGTAERVSKNERGDTAMDLQTALQQLEALQQKQYAYRTASSALYLDGVTVAPRDTAEGRGGALGILAGEEHKLFSGPQGGALLTLWE